MNHPDLQSEVVLEVEDLHTHFFTEEGELHAVAGVSFQLKKGKTLALVGESGCGKSVTAFSVMRLIQKPGKIVAGSIKLSQKGRLQDLLHLKEGSRQLDVLRGGQVSMIFQDALAALSPVHTIENHLLESLMTHRKMSENEAKARALSMLKRVGLSKPEVRMHQYPHELSGGMRQRVMVAMALIAEPAVVIADEPTTALDVTIQLQVLELIKDLQRELGCAVLLITHDFGVVAHSADEVAVMYLGRIVERGHVQSVLSAPKHPYTVGLLGSLPSRARGKSRLLSIVGSVPALSEVPSGCSFHPRCPHYKNGLCDEGDPPPLIHAGPQHEAACLRLDSIHTQSTEG